MSSSNLVSIVYEKEAEYGVRADPSAGSVMYTARFTSEEISGTPTTTESVELRTDRMSSGQVAVGLEVGGPINFELSNDVFHDDFLEAAMLSTWVPAENTITVVNLVPDPLDNQKAVMTLGAEQPNLVPLTLCQIRGVGIDTAIVSIISVDVPSTVFTVATMRGQEEIVGEDVVIPQHVDIGADVTSFLIGKSYLDVQHLLTTDNHSQTYTGEMLSGFSINAAWGEIVTGSYATMGNGYEQEAPSYEQQVVTAGGTVNPPGTTNTLNASIDVPLVIANDVATDFCTQSFTLTLDNGLDPTTCIGKSAPTDYSLGTASISIDMSIYNSDTSYDAFMDAKITQNPISMTYVTENLDGGYGFAMPAVQLTFPDPSSQGQNEQTMLEASGTAKVGPNGESALRIYKL